MDGVVLLHGIANFAASLRRIERALRMAGYRTFNLDYPSCSQSVDDLAASLHASISDFAGSVDGRLHVVAHSMGGLVARTWIAHAKPANLGRVVMLAPPNGGSEIADRLRDTTVYRRAYGPAGRDLTTAAATARKQRLGPPDYCVGIIAGDRSINPMSKYFKLPRPNDGTVSVASSRLEGMADHIVLPTAHTLMLFDRRVIVQVAHFLRDGRFYRES
jgi:pimeloyl-ACP methyl ester carboxylesterase